ncbi:MAG: HWE histidine kinase domain-containing protein [Pseudomonadota bacterium]
MTLEQDNYLDIEDAQNRRNAAALAAGNIGVFEFEPQSRRAFWDDRIRQLWGAEPHDEIDYDYVVSKVDPRDRQLHDDATASALDPDGNGEMDFEYRLIAGPDRPETWVRAKAKCKFENGRPIMLVGTVEDITVRKLAELRNELLLRELQHRLKNTMAVVSTIVNQSRRTTDSVDELAASLTLRLRALAGAQDVLQKNSWEDVELSYILQDAADAFSLDEQRLRTTWDDTYLIPEQYVMSMSLALYELASNSLKHGALKEADGVVDISCKQIDGQNVFVWKELGGPNVATGPLPRTGFGSVLLLDVLPSELEGTASYMAEGGEVSYTLNFKPTVQNGA